ncbi:helix-turn-helix domain-containing protein [Aeromonas caviae]|uniref:Helix-turn-helix domain-containing protein n=2 Tax=Aeromonas caviae TaxID=648 RepID=A0A7T3X2F5_AERCA|nr:helix-turn-helix domain-containing protein [Aeromonas caviae]
MQILKAYKFRLEPTEQQAQRLRQLGGCARYVWNHGLAETKRILDAGEKLPSAFLITHDPQPASRVDMASEGLPRLHAPILPTCY